MINRRPYREDQLETSEALFRAVFEDAPIGISLSRPDGSHLRTNQRVRAILGYTDREMQHLTFRDFTYPEDLAIELPLYADLLAGRRGRYELDKRVFRKDGEVLWVHLTASRVVGPHGETECIVRMWEDVSERKREEQALQQQVSHDALTALPNRVLFADRLHHELAAAKRRGDVVAVLFVDLDSLKAINDTYGHGMGDRFLQLVAERLGEAMRTSDTVARLAGDEFTMILSNVGAKHNAAAVAEKLLDAVRSITSIDASPVKCSASIGISLFPFDGQEPARLLQFADHAMYQAKAAGGDRYAFADETTSLMC